MITDTKEGFGFTGIASEGSSSALGLIVTIMDEESIARGLRNDRNAVELVVVPQSSYSLSVSQHHQPVPMIRSVSQ